MRKAKRSETDALLGPAREVLLDSKPWRAYMRRIRRIIKSGDHPYYTYVGVNFNEQAIKNYKFYFSFYRPLSPAELDDVLPVPDRSRFDEFYPQWHPTYRTGPIHRGVTFAVKVDTDGSLTHYYHLRLRGLPFGPPERIQLRESDRDNHHGVCEEFKGGKAHLKRYFYLFDKTTIAESLVEAGMPPRAGWIDCLEYIESDGRDKLDWVSYDLRLNWHLIHTRGPAWLPEIVQKICDECNFALYGPGSARGGGDHSIYFFEKPSKDHFDGIGIFASKYLPGLD